MKTGLVLRPMLASLIAVGMFGSVAFTACSEPATTDPATGGSSSSGTGGAATGGAPTGGAPTGGAPTGGAPTGGAPTGGAPTGGTAGSGGTDPVAGAAGSGGTDPVAGAAGSGGTSGAAGGGAGGTAGQPGGSGGTAGGATGGSGGGVAAAMGPCDIYGAASPATPCVAAYSTVRRLSSTYTGPLYQVRRGGPDPNTGSGGETQDIAQLPNGFADAASHTTFCGTTGTCTFSVLYDQSGRGNNLTVAKRGCYEGTAAEDDYESDAKRRPLTVGGNNAFALYMDKHEGYRDNTTMGMPTGNTAQGVYMVAEGSGRRQGAGCCCCWNFGNASTDNCYGPSGQMNALYLGVGYWGRGQGSGPWFMGDFEAGVWAGGTGASNATNSMLPSMTMNYAFGILKTNPTNYAIRVGDATTGNLTTAYDGGIPTAFNGRWTMEGGIILGIGGDNSNSSDGTFLEGAITNGRPTDATDQAVHENVKAMRYGM